MASITKEKLQEQLNLFEEQRRGILDNLKNIAGAEMLVKTWLSQLIDEEAKEKFEEERG